MARTRSMLPTGDPALDEEARKRRAAIYARYPGAAEAAASVPPYTPPRAAALAPSIRGTSIDPATGLPYTGALKPAELQPGEYGFRDPAAGGARARALAVESSHNVTPHFAETGGPTPGAYEGGAGAFRPDLASQVESDAAAIKAIEALPVASSQRATALAGNAGLNLRGDPATPAPAPATRSPGGTTFQRSAGGGMVHIGTAGPPPEWAWNARREALTRDTAFAQQEADKAAPGLATRGATAEVAGMEAQAETQRYIAQHPEVAIMASQQPVLFQAAMQKRAQQRQSLMDQWKMASARKDVQTMTWLEGQIKTLDATPFTLGTEQAGPSPLPAGASPEAQAAVQADEEARALAGRGMRKEDMPVGLWGREGEQGPLTRAANWITGRPNLQRVVPMGQGRSPAPSSGPALPPMAGPPIPASQTFGPPAPPSVAGARQWTDVGQPRQATDMEANQIISDLMRRLGRRPTPDEMRAEAVARGLLE